MSVIVKYRNQNKNRKESSTCWASQPLKIPDTFVLLKHDKATELPSACSHRQWRIAWAVVPRACFIRVMNVQACRPHDLRAFRVGVSFAAKEKESKLSDAAEVLPSMSDLMIASLQGDEEEVREWLDDKGALVAKDMDGRTALIYAVQPGHENIVRLLLDAGANANVKDRDGKSALTCATLWGRLGVMKQLIDAGAHTEAFDASGATALMYAAFKGNVDPARVLLENNADVNATDLEGRTALMFAASQGKVDVGKLLLDKGAQQDRKDLQGWTAVQFASNGGHDVFLGLLNSAKRKENNTP